MKCHGFVIVALSLLVVVGCGQPIVGFSFRAAPTVDITGIVAKTAVGDQYAFADFEETFFDHKSMKKKAKADRKFATTQYMKIEISGKGDEHYHDYFVLLGPPIGSNEEASGVLRNSDPTFKVSEGWAYVSGDHARASVRWVSGAAEGTKIVVQKVNDDEANVYLLANNYEGASMELTCSNGTEIPIFYNAGLKGWFVNIKAPCTWTGRDLGIRIAGLPSRETGILQDRIDRSPFFLKPHDRKAGPAGINHAHVRHRVLLTVP